jgi:hypothetical protein
MCPFILSRRGLNAAPKVSTLVSLEALASLRRHDAKKSPTSIPGRSRYTCVHGRMEVRADNVVSAGSAGAR